TNDFNLNKVAQVQGVDVINVNDVAGALRQNLLPGERLRLRMIKAGEQPGQGVGYLEDGTMVVADECASRIGQDVELIVASVGPTGAGRPPRAGPASAREEPQPAGRG